MATIISKNTYDGSINNPPDINLYYYFTLEVIFDNKSHTLDIEVSKEIFNKYQEHDVINL